MDTYQEKHKQEIKNQRVSPRFLAAHGKRQMENEANYWNGKGIVDTRTGEIIKGRQRTTHDVADAKLKDANFASVMLEEQIKETLVDHSLVFLTATLPPSLHGNKRIGWDRKGKPIYSKTLATYGQIEQGFINLEIFHRDIYQTMKDITSPGFGKFEKVVEPHKSWTPHTHTAIYLPTKDLPEFKTRMVERIKILQARGIIGSQIDIEYPEMSEGKPVGSYIKKYLKKSIKDFNYELHGWYSFFKIVQFRNSNPVIPKKQRTKIYNATRNIVDYAEEGYKSLNQWVYHNVGYFLESRTIDWGSKTKPDFNKAWKHGNKDSGITIFKKVERTKIQDSKKTQEPIISSRLLGLKVFRGKTETYNNKWFNLITLGLKQLEETKEGVKDPLDTIIANCRETAKNINNRLINRDDPPLFIPT